MNLHEHKEEFEELIAIVADYIGVPVDAVRRDYYIVQMMQNLQNSEYAEHLLVRTIQYHQIIHSGQRLLFRKRLPAIIYGSEENSCITFSNIDKFNVYVYNNKHYYGGE